LAENVDKNFKRLFSLLSNQLSDVNFLGVGGKRERYLIGLLKQVVTVNYKIDKQRLPEYTADEQKVIDIIASKLYSKENVKFLFEVAKKLKYIGDHWSAINILKVLKNCRHIERYEVYKELAISYNGIGEGELAEEFYIKCINQKGCPKSVKVTVYYSLSMLFLRHHNFSLHDTNRGEEYLNLAYEILSEPSFSSDVFNRVFNRNGFALCLYKRGRIREAIKMLKWGLIELEKVKGESASLHASVLLYNLCLCYKKLAMPKLAIKYYRYLLNADPKMLEYRSDFINYLIDINKSRMALRIINDSGKYFPNSETINSLKGRLLYINGKYKDALACFTIAYNYNMFKRENINNYLLTKFKLEEYVSIVNSARIIGIRNAIKKNLFNDQTLSIISSAYYNIGNIKQCKAILQIGIKNYPTSELLQQNLKLVNGK
jgi:tetratricopeptide (TPR) repeat protein